MVEKSYADGVWSCFGLCSVFCVSSMRINWRIRRLYWSLVPSYITREENEKKPWKIGLHNVRLTVSIVRKTPTATRNVVTDSINCFLHLYYQLIDLWSDFVLWFDRPPMFRLEPMLSRNGDIGYLLFHFRMKSLSKELSLSHFLLLLRNESEYYIKRNLVIW